MNSERRKFLQQLAAVCAGGVARTLGVGCSVAVTANAAAVATTASVAAAAVAAPALGAYGSGVRATVLEVIARQVIVGAQWKEICMGPMHVNNITEADVEKEVQRRNQIKHRDTDRCDCNQCILSAFLKNQEEVRAINAIPHTEKAPCACTECRFAVTAMLEDVRKKIGTTRI